MKRRYDLDWLRVFAFGLLMLFHTGMLFSTWFWHVKNLETSDVFDHVMRFVHQWRMPLLFFISGSAVWFAMERYSTWKYFLERHKRLLVPLVFGMLVVIPPQVYCERLYHQEQYSSFWDFYRTLFTSGAYPAGNLSWHHLWYIPYIWTYSMVMLPVCLWLRARPGRALLARVLDWMARPWALFLICIPSALSDVVLRPFWPDDANSLFGDWANFTHKLCFFMAGFVLASSERLYDAIAAQRRKFFMAGAVAFVLLTGIVVLGTRQALQTPNFHVSPVAVAGVRFLNNFQIWMWVLVALGYGRRYLSFNHPFLRYANEAVYPFYILHQTVIIILGYQLANTNWSIGVKFPLVVAATFVICCAIYALAIRPWNIVRVAFGMKWQRARPADAPERAGVWPIIPRALPLLWLSLLLPLCSCAPRGGALVSNEFDAQSLSGNRLGILPRQQLVVYLPPSYRSGTNRFPVLYFLPNFDNIVQRYTGGSYQGFRLKDAMDRLIRSGATGEVIVVVPNAHHFLGGSWYRNSPLTGNWEDYIVNDVVEYVDSHFRTIPSAGARGIAGHGMGGFGALELALKHPDRFSRVYAMSPALFDREGLKDLGLLDEKQTRLWRSYQEKCQGLDEPSRRRSFRDFMQHRLNNPSRDVFVEGLLVSYAAAMTPDLALPYPHIAFPVPGRPAESQAALLARYENGFGGWTDKLARYRARGQSLKAVTLEYGGDSETPWIRRGVAYLAGLMRAEGMPVSVAAHSGGHESALGQRLETGMLPAMANALSRL
jgi:hypothetical protein